jgi:hypothetical protein
MSVRFMESWGLNYTTPDSTQLSSNACIFPCMLCDNNMNVTRHVPAGRCNLVVGLSDDDDDRPCRACESSMHTKQNGRAKRGGGGKRARVTSAEADNGRPAGRASLLRALVTHASRKPRSFFLSASTAAAQVACCPG